MPHGRSQWAWTTREGLSQALRVDRMPPPSDRVQPRTYHRGRVRWNAVLVAGAGQGEWAALRLRPFPVEVRGASMEPGPRDGEWAVDVRARVVWRRQRLVVGHPGMPGFQLLQRVEA